jgi:hypothetical protein
MASDPKPHPDDWQPATSKPGELFTVEGQSRQAWSFLSGLKRRDRRLQPYRRSMLRSSLAVLGIGLAVVVLITVLAAIF